MGRVYNALVKAEKLKAEPRAPDDSIFIYGDATIEIVKPSRRIETARPPATLHHLAAAKARAEAVEPAVSSPRPAQPVAVVRHATQAAAPAARRVRPTSPPDNERRPLVAAVQAGAVVGFVEPRRVVTVAGLTIAEHLSAITGADPLANERYRALAGRLLNLASGRGLKSVLITSPLEGEGKSTIAINLAWALAKSARGRVLLIEANTANPSVCRMLGTDCDRGWLDAVEDRSGAAEAMVRLEPNRLYLLTLRPTAAGSGQSVAPISSRVEALVKEFEKDFDLIIIDGPAVVANACGQGLAAAVDGAVVVVRAAVTHHKDVRSAVKLIPKKHRLGVVLNDAGASAPAAARNGNHRFRLGSIFKRRG